MAGRPRELTLPARRWLGQAVARDVRAVRALRRAVAMSTVINPTSLSSTHLITGNSSNLTYAAGPVL